MRCSVNQAYVPVKIDVDRMTGGKEMDARYRGGTTGGIPFFAVLDADGNKLADAHVNVGFPVQPFEISHFIRTVRRTAPDLSTDQLEVLEKGLQPEKKEPQPERTVGFSVPLRDKD